MRINGLALLIDRAADRVPAVERYRRAITLGALREDVVYIPKTPKPFEHLSFSHFWGPGRPGGFLPFWPSARGAADRWFDRAVAEGPTAKGFVTLGRAAHLLADMACPVHVHRVIHSAGDGFEWYVEAHRDELGAIEIPSPPRASKASHLIESLATFTHRFPADRTQHPLGRWMIRRGLAKQLPQTEIRRAAHAIIPVAIAHMVSLLELYAERTRMTERSR